MAFKQLERIAQRFKIYSKTFIFLALPMFMGMNVVSAAFIPEIVHAQQAKIDSIDLPKGFAHPNGITHGPDGTIYVGSVTSGNIIKLGKDGSFKTIFKQSKNIYAGTALRFDPLTNILWVASPYIAYVDFSKENATNGKVTRQSHKIAAIDVSRGKEIWSSDIPNNGLGNDFALDGKGGIFITDSLQDKVLHLEKPGAVFKTVAAGPLMKPGDIGPAGIVKLPNGGLIIGLWRDGGLLHIKFKKQQPPIVTRLQLDRPIENPDGLGLAPDGRLLIVAGGATSGNGQLLAIDLSRPQPYKIDVLLDKLDTPVNLTVKDNTVYISEGRIGHLMKRNKPNLKVPDSFRIIKYHMGKVDGVKQGE